MSAKAKFLRRALLVLSAVGVTLCMPEDHYVQAANSGWTCLPGYGRCDEWGMHQGIVDATVGLPFEWVLLASCNTGRWTSERSTIDTGRLPPGLEFGNEYGDSIVGVPTRAGSFSFTVTHHGISCPGSDKLDWTMPYTIEVRGN